MTKPAAPLIQRCFRLPEPILRRLKLEAARREVSQQALLATLIDKGTKPLEPTP